MLLLGVFKSINYPLLEAVMVVSDMLTTLYLFQVSLVGDEGFGPPTPCL